jgi:hypothetical protein
MTDKELTAFLRDLPFLRAAKAADRIEQLVAINEALTEELTVAEQRGYANAMEAERKLHEDRIEALTAERDEQIEWVKRLADMQIASEVKLATCEKYRDAYAECDRIGTQAVRDIEAKLAKAMTHVMDYSNDPHLVQFARATLAEIEGLGVKQTG